MANTAVAYSDSAVTGNAYIDSKGHNLKLKSSRNYLTKHTGSNHATSYLCPQGWTRRHTQTYQCLHESDFMKPGTWQPTPSVKINSEGQIKTFICAGRSRTVIKLTVH